MEIIPKQCDLLKDRESEEDDSQNDILHREENI
jgi:hypothetical protein